MIKLQQENLMKIVLITTLIGQSLISYSLLAQQTTPIKSIGRTVQEVKKQVKEHIDKAKDIFKQIGVEQLVNENIALWKKLNPLSTDPAFLNLKNKAFDAQVALCLKTENPVIVSKLTALDNEQKPLRDQIQKILNAHFASFPKLTTEQNSLETELQNNLHQKPINHDKIVSINNKIKAISDQLLNSLSQENKKTIDALKKKINEIQQKLSAITGAETESLQKANGEFAQYMQDHASAENNSAQYQKYSDQQSALIQNIQQKLQPPQKEQLSKINTALSNEYKCSINNVSLDDETMLIIDLINSVFNPVGIERHEG